MNSRTYRKNLRNMQMNGSNWRYYNGNFRKHKEINDYCCGTARLDLYINTSQRKALTPTQVTHTMLIASKPTTQTWPPCQNNTAIVSITKTRGVRTFRKNTNTPAQSVLETTLDIKPSATTKQVELNKHTLGSKLLQIKTLTKTAIKQITSTIFYMATQKKMICWWMVSKKGLKK